MQVRTPVRVRRPKTVISARKNSGPQAICPAEGRHAIDAGGNTAIHPRGDEGNRPDPDSIESNVRAIFFQLLAAQASLLRLYPDEICLELMDDCIALFKEQHHLIDHDEREGILWEETSLETLLRLLEYLHREIAEELDDRRSAAELKLCINRLRQIVLL